MKQNGVVRKLGPVLLFFIFWFEYLISGPKSYQDVPGRSGTFEKRAPAGPFVS